MSDQDWELLVKACVPDGKRVCNCSWAYETYVPDGATKFNAESGSWEPSGAWVCEYGCSANQINARNHVAKIILAKVNA